jgi:hypothetical protein
VILLFTYDALIEVSVNARIAYSSECLFVALFACRNLRLCHTRVAHRRSGLTQIKILVLPRFGLVWFGLYFDGSGPVRLGLRAVRFRFETGLRPQKCNKIEKKCRHRILLNKVICEAFRSNIFLYNGHGLSKPSPMRVLCACLVFIQIY